MRLSSWKFFKFWEPIQHPWKALFEGGGGIGPFVAQRWSNIGEIFTSILADKNTAWIIFPKFEFLRKWDRSFEENFDPLLQPISHWRWPNQNSQWKNAAIRLSKYVKVKTLSSFQFKRKIRLLLAIFWHFWTKKQGVVRG